MKKVVYGIVILIGLLCISTNFIINEKNIDFKKTSASGTACKWISESGYGMGPYYVTGVATDATKYLKGLQLLTCNSSNAGTVKDANKLYNQDGSLYSGSFKIYTVIDGYADHSRRYHAYEISNGLVTCHGIKDTSSVTCDSQDPAPAEFLRTYTSIYFGNGTSARGEDALYPGSEQTEWNFTCVCAEY